MPPHFRVVAARMPPIGGGDIGNSTKSLSGFVWYDSTKFTYKREIKRLSRSLLPLQRRKLEIS
jgi:hypothetical protein